VTFPQEEARIAPSTKRIVRTINREMGDAVEKDDYVPPSGATNKAIEEVKRIQKMNQKAADISLNSILTDTERGQSVFCLTEKFHNAKAGFASGQFHKEWTAMTTRYKEVESKSITDSKEECYGAKMKDDQQPSLFIVQMKRLNIKMKEKGHDIKDDDFLHDILSKLPKSRSSLMMNPCQIKQLFIKEKLTAACTLDVLTIDLEKTHVENIEETKNKKGSSEGEKGFYTSGKPFKGKCYNCGKMGHVGKDCSGSSYKKGNNHTMSGGHNKVKSKDPKKFMGTCNHCVKFRHKKIECYKLNGKPNN